MGSWPPHSVGKEGASRVTEAHRWSEGGIGAGPNWGRLGWGRGTRKLQGGYNRGERAMAREWVGGGWMGWGGCDPSSVAADLNGGMRPCGTEWSHHAAAACASRVALQHRLIFSPAVHPGGRPERRQGEQSSGQQAASTPAAGRQAQLQVAGSACQRSRSAAAAAAVRGAARTRVDEGQVVDVRVELGQLIQAEVVGLANHPHRVAVLHGVCSSRCGGWRGGGRRHGRVWRARAQARAGAALAAW